MQSLTIEQEAISKQLIIKGTEDGALRITIESSSKESKPLLEACSSLSGNGLLEDLLRLLHNQLYCQADPTTGIDADGAINGYVRARTSQHCKFETNELGVCINPPNELMDYEQRLLQFPESHQHLLEIILDFPQYQGNVIVDLVIEKRHFKSGLFSFQVQTLLPTSQHQNFFFGSFVVVWWALILDQFQKSLFCVSLGLFKIDPRPCLKL